MRINSAVLLIFCAGLLLTACSGFQPRTENSATQVPLADKRVHISQNSLHEDILTILQTGLRASGARLVDEPAPGVIALKLASLREDKTVSAYSSVRQVREFNHYIELSFSAARQLSKGITQTKPGPEPMVATVRAERTQIYDSRFVLGVSEEEQIIRDELRAEVVRLLALRLSVL